MLKKITYKAEVIVILTDKERTEEFTKAEVAISTLALEQRVNAAHLLKTEYGKAAIRLHIGKEKGDGDD
jgi:hypothetical protein